MSDTSNASPGQVVTIVNSGSTSGVIDITLNVSARSPIGNWNPPTNALVSYYSPSEGALVTQSFPIGSSHGPTPITIRTGSLSPEPYQGEIQVLVPDSSYLPGIPGIFRGGIGEVIKRVNPALSAIDQVNAPYAFTVTVLDRAFIPVEIGAQYVPGFLEGLGINPANLPPGVQGVFGDGGALIGLSSQPLCFLAGAEIDMWPVELGTNASVEYDEQEVIAKVWKKPIEEVSPKDWVVSYDDQGKLKPGRVTRTFQNESQHILDVHGLMVTPGHVTYCAPVEGEDNPFAGQHVPIIDILRSDGALMKADGTLIRAATGCEVGSPDDEQFWVFRLYTDESGVERVHSKCQLRYGTRRMLPNGKHFSMREYLDGIGVEILKDSPHRGYARFKETGMITLFAWTLSDTLPKPEEFVLQRSQVTLEDIYETGQWEAVQPRMPTPYAGEAGRSFNRNTTLYAGTSLGGVAPNVPVALRNSDGAPAASRRSEQPNGAKKQKASRGTVH